MIAALALVAYALTISVLMPRLLPRALWVPRAPKLAIAIWQATTASVIGALILAGLVLAVPAPALADGVAGLLRSCEMAIRDAYANAGGLALTGTGLVLAGAVAARTTWCLAAAVTKAARLRARHRAMLQMVGRRSAALQATIVDTHEAAAYCLPGRSGHVVITTGALAALSDHQLAAVLAHERAHLAGRHHLVIAAARGLARAFPGVPLFSVAHDEIGRLIEMLADDAAALYSDRTMVATALVALADATTPVAALAAGGPTALRRVRRLLAPANPLGRARSIAGSAVVAVALAAPVVIAVAPAAAVIGMHWCSGTTSAGLGAASSPSTIERYVS